MSAEVDFELIQGVSLGFEICTDREVIEDYERAVVLIDILIFRIVVAIL